MLLDEVISELSIKGGIKGQTSGHRRENEHKLADKGAVCAL